MLVIIGLMICLNKLFTGGQSCIVTGENSRRK